MSEFKFPPGWDEQRVKRLIQHDQTATEDEQVADDDATVAERRELEEHTYQEICKLCQCGDKLEDEGRFAEAIETYWSAWEKLPEPRTVWEAATWILAAIGDANFQQGNYEAGRDNLSMAMHCPNAIGNPFLHLRLGQCQFELHNYERAADELARAFLLEGVKLFADGDPKYLEFIKTRLDEPPGGWPVGW